MEQVREDLRLALGALGVKPPTPEPEGEGDGDKQEKEDDVGKGEEEEGRGKDKGKTMSSTAAGQSPLSEWARQVDCPFVTAQNAVSSSLEHTPIKNLPAPHLFFLLPSF